MYIRRILLATRRMHGCANATYMNFAASEVRGGTLSEAIPSCAGRSIASSCSNGSTFRCFYTPARRWLPSRLARHAAPQHGSAGNPATAQQHGLCDSRQSRRHLAAQAIAAPAADVQSNVEYADGRVVKVRSCCHSTARKPAGTSPAWTVKPLDAFVRMSRTFLLHYRCRRSKYATSPLLHTLTMASQQ
jgi:hypothetical protein